ncbi:MAG TPA: hypothetical protein VMY42_25000 [Thermoguttaceae bacterium]|nr:hypothetical protein [Thermoguttaceae bacterium]
MTKQEESVLTRQVGEIAALSERVGGLEGSVRDLRGDVRKLVDEAAKRAGREEYRQGIWRPAYEALVKTMVPSLISGGVVAGVVWVFLREFGTKLLTK